MTRRDRGSATTGAAAGLLLIAAFAVAPTGIARAQQPAPAGSGAAAPAAPVAPTGIPVQAAKVQRADVPVLLRNIGSVQAFQSVLVRARVDGTLDKIYFTEGQDVKAGDKIAEIDPRPYIAALAQAKAKRAADESQMANAQRDLARYANLVSKDFASHQQVDTQAAQVAQMAATIQGDDATIATAQLNVDFSNITSPIDGRIGLRQVDVGNLIHANDVTGIVTIAQIHPISVVFTLPQDSLPQIQAAMAKQKLPVFAYTSDEKTLLGKGTLLTTDNTIDPNTGTIRLKAVFPNDDNALWPGQFVNAHLQIGTLPNAVTIPSPAVQRGPNGLFVYVIKPDSTVAIAPIEVAQDDGTTAVISKGLDDKAQVVTAGQSRLQNGVRVTIIQPKSTS